MVSVAAHVPCRGMLAVMRWVSLLAALWIGGCGLEFDAGLLDAGVDSDGRRRDAPSDGGRLDADGEVPTDGPSDDAVVANDASDGDAGCDVALREGMIAEAEPPAGPRPEQGATFHDPTWNACVRRVTDVEGEYVNAGTAHRSGYNADGTRILVQTNRHEFLVYDASTLALVRRLGQHSDDSPVWHPTDPDVVRSIDGSDPFRVREVDVTTGVETELWDFTAPVKAQFPDAAVVDPPIRAEGRNASADGLRWALEVRTATDRLGYVVVDAASTSLLGSNANTGPISSQRMVGISPSGEHTVYLECDSGTQLHDEELTFVRTIVDGDCPYEWDFAFLADGREAFVYAHEGQMRAHVLESGEELVVLPDLRFGASDEHSVAVRISGTAHRRPGWVALSFYKCEVSFGAGDCEDGFTWQQDRVVLMQLEEGASGRILNLAWNRSFLGGSNSVPLPSAAPDASRVLFVSPWDEDGGPIDLYEITVPPSAL